LAGEFIAILLTFLLMQFCYFYDVNYMQLQSVQLKERIEELGKLSNIIIHLEKRQSNRNQQAKAWQSQNNEHARITPLFKKIKENYEKNFVIPELELKKERLQNLRDLYKPVIYYFLSHLAKSW
jgi:hypothetical protein